jgi:zinc protease
MKRSLVLSLALVSGLTLAAVAVPARAQAPGGNKGTAIKAVQRLNRAPVNKEVLRVHLPRPSVHKLSNGLAVVVLEQHKLPTVAFEMWIKPGALDDPKDMPGLASFTADMLREGTAKRTSAQIAAEVDRIGATLDAGSNFGTSYTTVNASGLADSAEALVDLMSDIVMHPSFPADELEKYKQRELAGLEQDRSQPGFLAREKFYEVLYGNFPAAVTSPTPQSVKGVTPDDLRRFHSRHYRPGNALLGVVGDVKTDDVLKLLEKYFAAWAGGPEPSRALAAVPAPQPAKITLVDRPGSVQTNLIAGDLGVRRNDPDYVALAVMNRVVGGGPQARLFLNLREDKGYTYGAYSNFRADIYPGPWVANTEVRNNVTDGSMHELMYELRRIRDEAVPQPELEEAERSRIAAFALSLERPRTLLDAWLEVRYYGLSEDYWDKYPDSIAAVTAAMVQEVAKKYVDLDHLQIVAVGDAKQVKDALAKYGPVSTFDTNGKPEN